MMFFMKGPEAAESNPRALQSLQTLDGALLLVSLGLYPQAQLCCDRAARLAGPEGAAGRESDGLLGFDEAAEKLFRSTLPALEVAFRQSCGFDLRAALWPDVREHLAIAEDLIASREDGDRARTCCRSLEFALRWTIRENFMSPWLIEVEEARERGEVAWEPPFDAEKGFPLDCPMCQMTADCELGFDEAAPPAIWVERMHCRNCDFWVEPQHRRLSGVLFKDELATNRDRILAEYGLLRKQG